MDTLLELQIRSKLQNLYQQHRELDVAIAQAAQFGSADPLHLQRLKKTKLGLKDQIAKIETLLIPDIIA